MTDQYITFPRFYLTVPSPCPYLPGRLEQKIFTELKDSHSTELNDSLSKVGFRRSQNVAYRPACDGCNACQSVRIVVDEFAPTRNMKRIWRRNTDLGEVETIAQATQEQFDLLSSYLETRHAEGGMAGMDVVDYSTMIEQTPVNTHVTEYRARPLNADGPQSLVAACLTDKLDDGLSMIYSFYDTHAADRSLGTYMILAHIEWARRLGLPHVYLGYWIKDSEKMSYKARFQPLEVFRDDEWQLMVN